MRDWNVVVTVREGGFARARELLAEYGEVWPSDYLNILAMRVENPLRFLQTLLERESENPGALDVLGRVLPVERSFTYQSPEEFERKANDAVSQLAPELAGKRFHVRMYRHGFKGRLSSSVEERMLGQALLDTLKQSGAETEVSFDDPDAILVIEMLGNRAGLCLCSREDLRRYPFLRVD